MSLRGFFYPLEYFCLNTARATQRLSVLRKTNRKDNSSPGLYFCNDLYVSFIIMLNWPPVS